jgi:hypothetical protein
MRFLFEKNQSECVLRTYILMTNENFSLSQIVHQEVEDAYLLPFLYIYHNHTKIAVVGFYTILNKSIIKKRIGKSC